MDMHELMDVDMEDEDDEEEEEEGYGEEQELENENQDREMQFNFGRAAGEKSMSSSSSKNLERPRFSVEEDRRRFILELEFVQQLASPDYLHCNPPPPKHTSSFHFLPQTKR